MNLSQFVVKGSSTRNTTSKPKWEYDVPVLVIQPFPTKPRVGSDMEFNQKALNALNLVEDEHVVFLTHLYQDGRLFIVNGGKQVDDQASWNLQLAKNGRAIKGSTRKAHEILADTLNYAILKPTMPTGEGDDMVEGVEVVLQLVEPTNANFPDGLNVYELVAYVEQVDETFTDEEQQEMERADSQQEAYDMNQAEADASVNQW